MATIKSFTSLEQSRKLAEILPLESADQVWERIAIAGANLNVPEELQYRHNGDIPFQYYSGIGIPCWSLAVLLDVMPQINDWITPYGHKNDKLFQFEPKICKIWEHSIIPSYKVTYDNGLSTDIYDNPIDACVDMIEHLHKLNLL